MVKEQLKELYIKYTGEKPTNITKFPTSGSNRSYFRLEGKLSLIGVKGESKEENEAFLYMAEHFRQKGLPVPQVMAVSDDRMLYLQEDLGNRLLFDTIEHGRTTQVFHHEEVNLLKKTIRLLPALQFTGAQGFDFSHCHPLSDFNRRCILWDLNYFKYCFLKATGLDFQEDRLEDDFQALATVLLQCDSSTFMYRDFQSRNVMIRHGEPWFIDFQGGRKGPYYYDVASFLWQAKANLTDELRQELLTDYIDELKKFTTVNEAEFHSRMRHFVLFRTLQVLGAYGFRGYFEKKAHFLQSIPYAIGNLRKLLANGYAEYPYLCGLLKQLTDLPQFAAKAPQTEKTPQPLLKAAHSLVVSVKSFSYKKGIPQDASGNGGGFVFDCRAVHNPGRYDRYKPLTGLDKPVVEFLENDGEISSFLTQAYALVDASVKRYLERGFTSLTVYFGCTGGQHRSVYSAEHLAEHVHQKFGVKVDLEHREQGIHRVLEAE